MKAVVEGVRAIALILHGDDAEAVKLISPLKVAAEGNVLSIEWRAPAETVWAHAQKMCAKMKAHMEKMKGHLKTWRSVPPSTGPTAARMPGGNRRSRPAWFPTPPWHRPATSNSPAGRSGDARRASSSCCGGFRPRCCNSCGIGVRPPTPRTCCKRRFCGRTRTCTVTGRGGRSRRGCSPSPGGRASTIAAGRGRRTDPAAVEAAASPGAGAARCAGGRREPPPAVGPGRRSALRGADDRLVAALRRGDAGPGDRPGAGAFPRIGEDHVVSRRKKLLPLLGEFDGRRRQREELPEQTSPRRIEKAGAVYV